MIPSPPLRALLMMLLALTLALLFAGGTALALSEEELERRVQQISDELRCPTCQALSVKDSEASFSKQIRDKVRRMVEEGQSDDDIKAYFVARYGEWILRAPKKEGLGLVLWILPGAAILGVGGLLVWRVRRSAKQAESRQTVPPSLSPQQRERLERDLKRFKEED
jgi:cytochrome c-type biogenesis protein CcmH